MPIEIYIGAPIQYQSERATLRALVRELSSAKVDAIIVANAELGGRQLDFIVALDRLTLLIEAKSGNAPVRGTANGPWQYQVAAGGWKDFPNPYRQAVDGKNALRDAMRKHANTVVAYPMATVVFAPSIPAGSSPYHGDMKASVIGLRDMGSLLKSRLDDHWTLGEWHSFIATHGFAKVNRPEAAFSEEIAAAETLIEGYCAAFRETYTPLAGGLVSFPCEADDGKRELVEIIHQGASGANLLLKGPSGCGKSLAGYSIGLEAVNAGRLPIIIQGKNFDDNLGQLINAEVTLLDVTSAKDLLGACARLHYPIALIVDGYNECASGNQERFARGIAALSRRYGTTIVISSQEALPQNSRLQLRTIAVPLPDIETKTRIAQQAAGKSDGAGLSQLLNSVASGLEARLVGEVGTDFRTDASRFALYDAYVRKVLGRDAVEGIRALTEIAGMLFERVSFGCSVRDLDRLTAKESIAPATITRLRGAHFLDVRVDRVTFGHELFLNAFTAEALIRGSQEAQALLVQIHSPQNKSRQVLLLGAIEDPKILVEVINGIADSSLVVACLEGQCGAHAKEIAEKAAADVLRRVPLEIQQLEAHLDPGGWLGVRLAKPSEFEWSPQEGARLAAVGVRLGWGHNFAEIMELFAAIDRRLSQELARLREAAIAQNVFLRTGLFANVYVQNSKTGVGLLCQAHSMGLHSVDKIGERLVLEWLKREVLSPGQLYVLLELNQRTALDAPEITSLLPGIFERHWPRAPYHLKLELLHSAQFCARDGDIERAALLQVLQDLPKTENLGLNTVLIEAMQSLGGFDDSQAEFLEMARSEIREVLGDPTNPLNAQRAHGAWFWQFEDGPYTPAYCEAISELAPNEKKAFLEMAGRGADDEGSFLNILMMELARDGDPAVSEIIGRWTALPPTRCFMPQEAIRNFATAHILLARLGAALPPAKEEQPSDPAEALRSCGELLYWLNRVDLPKMERRNMCAPPWKSLLHHVRGVSAGVLSDFYNTDLRFSTEGAYKVPGDEEVADCIGSAFPTEVGEICRECLTNPVGQRGYFDTHDKARTLEFAQNGLGSWGKQSDLILLRAKVSDKRLGYSAMSAIETLEAYLASSEGTPRPPFRNARVIGL